MEKKVSGLQAWFVGALLFLLPLSWNTNKVTAREFYQLTVYHFKNAEQERSWIVIYKMLFCLRCIV